ncbi:MAG: hypothetical protein HRT88_10110 [Lentisphaeraceae bacterium]|nr:hypothetical protein [Lentisphaeraceae bacterium]
MKNLFLSLIIIILSSTLKAENRKVIAINPKRISPKIIVTKKTKKNRGSYMKNCDLNMNMKISNKNKAPLSDYSATLYIIGEHIGNKGKVNILYSFTEDVSIAAGKTLTTEKKHYNFSYYDYDYFSYYSSYSREYYSYIFILTDADGKQVLVKSPRSKLLKYVAKIIKLKSSYDFLDLSKGVVIKHR